MSLKLRIIDRRRTWIVAVGRSHGESRSRLAWLAIQNQHKHKDWKAIFLRALDLLMEEVLPEDPPREEPVAHTSVSFAGGEGTIVWQRRAFWTIIRLELSVYSEKKRRLIAAALLKAARYGF